MKSEEIKSFKIEFEGTEVDNFKSTIKKLQEENTKIGFGQILNPDEKELLKNLNEKINK